MENRLDGTQPILNYLNWVPGKVGQGDAKENPSPCRPQSQVPKDLCDFRQVSHPLPAPDIPQLSKTYTGGSQDWREEPGV